MVNRELVEQNTWQGYWWFPDDHDKKVPGTLTFSIEETPTLEINSIDEDLSNLFNQRVVEHKTIHGIDYSGKRITLCDVFATNKKSGFTGISITKYVVNRIYVGTHFENENEMRFGRIQFSVSNLWDWARLSGFNKEIVFDDKQKPQKYRIEYEPPAPINADLSDGIAIRITSSSSFNFGFTNEVALSEKTSLEILSDKVRTFDEFMNDALVVSAFVSMGLSSPTYVYKARGFSDELYHVIDGNRKIPVGVDVHFQPLAMPNSDSGIRLDRIAFTYNAIEDRFPDMIRNWYRQFQALAAPMELYFGTLAYPKMFIDQRFMNLVEAFESLHRNTFGGEYMETEDYLSRVYQTLIQAIPDDLDKDFRTSLKGRLKYHNEYSLRKRIKSFISQYRTVFIGVSEDFAAGKIADTRNFFAHRTDELRANAANSAELYEMTDLVNRMIRTLILSIMGFDEHELESMLGTRT